MTQRSMDRTAVNNHGAFIWRIANLLRGTYKPAQYGSVILPYVVLRRLDCILEPTKEAVLAKALASGGLPADIALPRASGQSFYNVSRYDMKKLLGDPVNLRLFSRLIRTETRHESIDLSDVVLSDLAHREGDTLRLDLAEGQQILLDPLTAAGSGVARDPLMVKLAEVIARMNEVFDGGDFTDSDIGSLAEHVAKKMLENPTIQAQVRNNTPQQVAASPALETGFTDAIIEAQGAYADLTGQLLGAKDKREAFLAGLIELLYVVLPKLDAPA